MGGFTLLGTIQVAKNYGGKIIHTPQTISNFRTELQKTKKALQWKHTVKQTALSPNKIPSLWSLTGIEIPTTPRTPFVNPNPKSITQLSVIEKVSQKMLESPQEHFNTQFDTLKTQKQKSVNLLKNLQKLRSIQGKVNSESDFNENSFEIFVAEAAVKADPVVEINGMRIWIQPLRPEDYNLKKGMTLNDFLDLIGVLNDPARQAVVNGYRLQEGTEILTEQGIIRLDGNMLLVEALDLVGYERTPASLLLQYHGIEPCILVVDIDNQINPQRIFEEQVANINERILEQFHIDMDYLLDYISEFYILRNVQPYQKINFYRKFLQVYEKLKLDLEYTFNLPISDIIYNKLLNSLPTDPEFEFTKPPSNFPRTSRLYECIYAC